MEKAPDFSGGLRLLVQMAGVSALRSQGETRSATGAVRQNVEPIVLAPPKVLAGIIAVQPV